MESLSDTEAIDLVALERRISANADKIITRLQERKMAERGRSNRTKKFDNTLLTVFRDIDFGPHATWPLWVDDVLAGVCRLDWYRKGERSIPLSALHMVKIFSTLECITTYGISNLLCVGERQARRYRSACALAYPYLSNGWESHAVRTARYVNT